MPMLNFDIYSISYISSLYSVMSSNFKHFRIDHLKIVPTKQLQKILRHSEAVKLGSGYWIQTSRKIHLHKPVPICLFIPEAIRHGLTGKARTVMFWPHDKHSICYMMGLSRAMKMLCTKITKLHNLMLSVLELQNEVLLTSACHGQMPCQYSYSARAN